MQLQVLYLINAFCLGGDEKQLLHLAKNFDRNIDFFESCAKVSIKIEPDAGIGQDEGVFQRSNMVCGVPVVAIAGGGNLESISERDNGFLYPVGDTAQLTEKII